MINNIGRAVPRLELPEGARGLLPPWYATVPDLRKGNSSRCNIKRVERGTRRGGPGGSPPFVRPWRNYYL